MNRSGRWGQTPRFYLQLERQSFLEHLEAHQPDLVVLMVGGNDAMKIRKGWTDLKKVTPGPTTSFSRFLGANCQIRTACFGRPWTPVRKKAGR